jgi:predicted ATPase
MPDTPQPAPKKTAGDPASAVGFSGTSEGGRTPDNNLPLRLSGLVGRGREIEEVGRLLADHRLLTLSGPGGSGKTRLALAVAHEVAENYEDGAWFVELAPLSLPDPGRPSDAEGLSEYAAARLFAERARAVKPGFEITEGNAMAVA